MSKNRHDVQNMTPEKAKELKTYVQAWNKQNVSQVLFHRTAYLNGMLSTTGYLQN